MSDIITRKGAKALGLIRYYTGKPCKRGHVGEWYVSSGICVECSRERADTSDHKVYKKAYYAANSERKKAYARAWGKANPCRAKAYVRAWRQSNQDKVRVYSRNRRALKRSAEGSHTAQDIQNIYDVQEGLCAYCKVEVGTDYHVDHIQPLSKGGSNSKGNLQITCPTCNLRKHTKTHEDFLAELKLDKS